MWKVLIYDSIGQSILAPIFSVKELRESGVTLHLALHSERYVLIYVCMHSSEIRGLCLIKCPKIAQ